MSRFGRVPLPPATRVLRRAERTGGPETCWPYGGAKTRHGYGWVSCRPGSPRLAHRIVYEAIFGTIPPGMGVLHRCDNPPCVNPTHLFLGTQGDNVQDAKIKGRMVAPPRPTGAMAWGERVGSAKLTWAQVDEARRRHSSGEGVNALARAFEVHSTTMSRLLRGIRWGRR